MRLALAALVVAAAYAGPADYYYKHWCGAGYQYLTDRGCAKKFPSDTNRNWVCPIDHLKAPPAGYHEDGPLRSVNVDLTSLRIPNDANVCVILTKRVDVNGQLKLYNKYFCAGARSRDEGWQTWSSSKIFAMANGVGNLRLHEATCAKNTFGMDSDTTGKNGRTPLGDLATVICSYDTTKGYSSNSLSSYFHDLGWRDRLYEMINDPAWLGHPAGISLGGNYGEATPADLSFTLHSPGGLTCNAARDTRAHVRSNTLTSLAAAEMTRRIVQWREIKPAYRFVDTLWVDAQAEMYGAANSVLFPGQQWGGMTADPAIFLQSGLNITDVERRARGQWRIFSKLGNGNSDMVNNAYACLPDFTTPGRVGGVEVTISVRGTGANVEQKVLAAMQTAIRAALGGGLQ